MNLQNYRIFTSENLHVSHRYDIVISYHVYMDWMSKTMHVLSVPDSWESDFMLGQTVIPPLHDIANI